MDTNRLLERTALHEVGPILDIEGHTIPILARRCFVGLTYLGYAALIGAYWFDTVLPGSTTAGRGVLVLCAWALGTSAHICMIRTVPDATGAKEGARKPRYAGWVRWQFSTALPALCSLGRESRCRTISVRSFGADCCWSCYFRLLRWHGSRNTNRTIRRTSPLANGKEKDRVVYVQRGAPPMSRVGAVLRGCPRAAARPLPFRRFNLLAHRCSGTLLHWEE